MAELSYNNTVTTNLYITLFQAIHGENPCYQINPNPAQKLPAHSVSKEYADRKKKTSRPNSRAGGSLQVVMIPKPNKDHSKVKGWRPIVLSNTVGRSAEKPIVDQLQDLSPLFHNLPYASRKWRSVIDAMMLMMSQAQRASKKSNQQATLLGKDVVSDEGTLN